MIHLRKSPFSFLVAAVLGLTSLSPTIASAQARPVAPAAGREAEGERITVQVGDQTTWPNENTVNYGVGAGGNIEVRVTPDGNFYVIRGVRPGQSSLLLIYEDGRRIRHPVTVTTGQESRAVTTTGVAARDNIRLDFYFVQLSENYSHNIGIGWPASLGGTQQSGALNLTLPVAPAFGPGTVNLVAQFLPRIDIGQTAGWARIMRQAVIVAANGEEANIESGGEVNIQVTGGFGGSLQRIPFGTIMKVTPRYDVASGRIEVRLETEISDLTPGSGQIPGRTRTAVNSLVNLELGQSIVLGGVTSSTTTQAQTGLPGLSQIPILGALFGANNRSEQQVENFVFIVPTVVQSVPRSQRDRVSEALRFYRDFGNIGGAGVQDLQLIEETPPGYR